MELKKLAVSFYEENPIVLEALDFNRESQRWELGEQGEKERGHGIVQVEIRNLLFAIPVRSKISHEASYILEKSRSPNPRHKGMGLDLSKALLIQKNSYITDEVFVLKTKQAGRKLLGKQSHIAKIMTRYVERYIEAVKLKKYNVLKDPIYRYSTLINYHKELGINS